MEYTSCQHCGARVSINAPRCPSCKSEYFMPLQQAVPGPPAASLWDKWLSGSTSTMALVGACLGGIYGLYLGMSNWGILATLILGIIGVIAGGVAGGAVAMLFSMGILLVAVLVPIVLVIAILIYAFSN